MRRLMSSGVRSTMKCWKIDQYGNSNDFLKLQPDVRVPPIAAPDHILIKVRAASVNPIDLRMRGLVAASDDLVDFPIFRRLRSYTIVRVPTAGPVLLPGSVNRAAADAGSRLQWHRGRHGSQCHPVQTGRWSKNAVAWRTLMKIFVYLIRFGALLAPKNKAALPNTCWPMKDW